ncbi:MAG TPA: transporter substrate-binding domain-containing protein [Azospirillaceae bacterium]|nr:transporter substrate-binding domain-containing protein [Azospirillaceae bacterium]
MSRPLPSFGRRGLLALPLLLLAPPARAEDWDVLVNHVGPEGWPPYYYGEAAGGGIALDLLAEIARLSGIRIETRYVPMKRGFVQFRQGILTLETLVADHWRRGTEIEQLIVYSDPLMQGEEVLLFTPGRAFPVSGPGDLAGREVATIRHYSYAGIDGARRVDMPQEATLVVSVAKGVVPVGIVERNVGRHIARSMGLAVEFGPVRDSYAYRLGVHRDKAHLLPRLNAAIRRLRDEGGVERIVERHLGPSGAGDGSLARRR